MATDLTSTPDTAPGRVRVVLAGEAQASGLADMMHQFLEQTLESPGKAEEARRLLGRAVFRAAEDEKVCVRLAFNGDRIELSDGAAPGEIPSITADFLTLAHLTSGVETPFGLLWRRKMRARFSLRQVPFLFGVLRFMKIESAPRPVWTHRAVWMTAAVVATAAIAYGYVTARP